MTAPDAPRRVLELRGVRKQYGSVVAVDGVDLRLDDGEFLTFLGPSGSGKTTTLMMVAGLQHPDAGTIALNGRDVVRLPAWRRDIGMVFQNYALFPHMSVRRNIAFPLEMRGTATAEADRRVAEMLRLIGLPDHGGRLPRELSGGQQQRVALARALVFGPSLLLMDEPLGALDRKLREQLQLEIKRIHRERRTAVLYVTHDQEEALTMSDRIAVFNHGRIEQIGTPEDLYERPATRFVAGFVGESNFFPARVLSVAGGSCELDCPLGRVRAQMRDGVTAGAAAVLAIRPERIRLTAATGDAAGAVAEITDAIYLGNARRCVMRLAGGEPCTALEPVQAADAHGLRPGGPVRLSWDSAHAIAFPAG